MEKGKKNLKPQRLWVQVLKLPRCPSCTATHSRHSCFFSPTLQVLALGHYQTGKWRTDHRVCNQCLESYLTRHFNHHVLHPNPKQRPWEIARRQATESLNTKTVAAFSSTFGIDALGESL